MAEIIFTTVTIVPEIASRVKRARCHISDPRAPPRRRLKQADAQ
jgi:hypothetical protein